ncbi:MAG: hypothetical protein IKS07_03105 [Lachnospiraceae bacterium]|nr:hypothetical protein [Lachnospiraceae bacterium]
MSNLVKNWNTTVEGDGKRVLDMNALVAKRIEALAAKMQRQENAGFVSGLPAESMEVEGLLFGEGAEGAEGAGTSGTATSGNVIKAPLPAEVQASAQAILDDANAQAQELLDRAREQAEALIADAHARIDAERKQAIDEGYESGYTEARRKADEELQAAKAELDRSAQELEQTYQQTFDEMETGLVDTITDVFEHVFRTDLKLQKPVVIHLVTQALQRIEGAKSFLIHVSRDNYEYVTARKGMLESSVMIPGSVIEIIEDLGLPDNSCLIETDGGIFDCSLGTELTELTTKLRLLSYTKKES